jgi:hypothetical protein
MLRISKIPLLGFMAILSLAAGRAQAFTIQIESSDFATLTQTFSGVTGFSLSIEVLGPLSSGVYANPALGDIEFLVSGSLDLTTPARMANPLFANFAVDDLAALSGQQFYDLGNSLNFEIAAGANLANGLQVSDLVGSGLVFEFDAHEDDTGRYHPPILQLFSDGTGSIQNSDNTGGINPFTGVEVNAVIGDEYIADLTFVPSALTLAVPEPGSAALLGMGLALMARKRRAH